ncbi:hypothetical protein L4D06_10590 [Enterovibrio makurazakiensis]|uniref:Nitrite reductase n=1 Tax=Enterovibrio gelatinilyticus TaxID=2899819 RepID=A0ABT5R3M8_9GAMM|nr:hypothetical protein [Enterovibrio sp. ZSDZ42]MDD1794859.1 hypothetical protein [Enterovibrio sp. ZSDZ42]
MDVFLFVFATVAVALAAKTLRSYFVYRAQLREFEINHQKTTGLNHAYQKELDTLRSRVEVLEKIVSSKGYIIDEEIQSLRSI